MRRESSSPEAYRADVETPLREILEAIRQLILEVAPDAAEEIEYGMLGYPGVANLAAQKNYVALYVAPAVLAEMKSNFPGVDSGKSCLRFTKLSQLDRVAMRQLLKAVRAYRKANAGEK